MGSHNTKSDALHSTACASSNSKSGGRPDFQDSQIAGKMIHHTGWAVMVIAMSRGFAFGAIFSAAAYLFSVLACAFFHESTVLFNRRHALRFGRLFIYLKFAGLNADDNKAVAAQRRALSVDDVERAFGWNIESSTGFKDINPRDSSAIGAYQKILDMGSKITTKASESSLKQVSAETE